LLPAPKIELAVRQITDRGSLIQRLLVETLEWPIPEGIEDLHELGYGWTEEDLRAQGLNRHLLNGGHVWQIYLRQGQPWGIIVVEFAKDKLRKSARSVWRR
jgi:hypothetical protein